MRMIYARMNTGSASAIGDAEAAYAGGMGGSTNMARTARAVFKTRTPRQMQVLRVFFKNKNHRCVGRRDLLVGFCSICLRFRKLPLFV